MIKRALGANRDSGRYPRRVFARRSAGAHPGIDLRPYAPAVMDQNLVGSCTGHGASAAIATSFAVAGIPLFGTTDGKTTPPSPRDIYAGARCLDREGRPVPLTDSGSEALAAVAYVARYGCRALVGMVEVEDPDTGARWMARTDCSPANCLDEPGFAELVLDAHHQIPQAHQIAVGVPSTPGDLASALDAGHAEVFSIYVDRHFMGLGPDARVVGIQDTSDPWGGGHCMAIVGYRVCADGRMEFCVRNSWSEGWGIDGDVWVGEGFIAQLWEAFAIIPGKVA